MSNLSSKAAFVPKRRTFSSHETRCQNRFKGRTFEMLRSSDGRLDIVGGRVVP